MTDPTPHSAFTWVRTEPVPTLRLQVEEYRHHHTGARHFHLSADDPQNAFLVAFRTVPQNSTGVAHILEHTSLCGSAHYPVRDPFFMMTRRSLSTFMNAFTSSDWTAYPFASLNKKDFYNLLRVYLDATFFPNLNELDFAQEGHRVELSKADDPDSELVYKGIVFNEMKGAMSSPVTTLWQTLTSHLFPTTTYHYNSGGDPEEIPKLSYEQLKAFHRSHYHPSNAVLMTFGDIPAAEHQAYFEDCALSRFQRAEVDTEIPDERRYGAPLAVSEHYAMDEPGGLEHKTHIVLGWLLGHSANMDAALEAHLLTGVLLDNSASPLRQALETSSLGSAPSPLCGLEDSLREMVLAAGLEGSDPEHAEALEALVLGVLQEVAEHGVPQETVEAMLHQVELSQREIGGDHFPYGLQLMLNGLGPALHGGDPAAALAIDPVLNRLRERVENPEYIKGMVRRLLLDNPHRVRLVLAPDPELSARRAADECGRLAALAADLSAADKQRLMERARALAARQARQDDPEILPKVGLEDVPAEMSLPQGSRADVGPLPATWYAQGTNGLLYQQLVIDLPPLEQELVDLLPLFCGCVTEVGSGGRDYLRTQAWQAAISGGISAQATVRGTVADVQQAKGYLVLSAKALARNQGALSQLVQETFDGARFDELGRLRELVSQSRLESEQSVTDRGHSHAILAACQGIAPSAALAHRWRGLEGVRQLKALDRSLDDGEALVAFAARLEQIRDRLREAPRQLLLVGEGEHHAAMAADLARRWGERPPPAGDGVYVPAVEQRQIHQAWVTSTQVSFCARAYPTVPVDHPDAAPLTVLGELLRNGFLHRAVREQGGAYGGGAAYDSDSGSFRFYSYRDPRLGETLADFDASLAWLQSQDHPWRTVEEAILGVISHLDKPGSPAGEAKRAFHNLLNGRSPEQRKRYRERVLGVTLADLQRVGASYLAPERASTAVLTNATTLDQNAALDLEPWSL